MSRAARILRTAAGWVVSTAVPRRPKLWLFSATGGAFIDNPKFLYLWVRENRPDINARWMVDKYPDVEKLQRLGISVLHLRSFRGLWATLRAEALVCDGVPNPWFAVLKGRSVLVNLWHGVGLKNIHFRLARFGAEAGKPTRSLWKYLSDPQNFCTPDLIVSTSTQQQRRLSVCFEVPLEKCPQIGTPRMDVLSDAHLREVALHMSDYTNFLNEHEQLSESYLYAPTFRDTGRDFLETALPDLNKLSGLLASRNAIMYIKLHRKSYSDLSNLPYNIKFWNDLDLYPVIDKFSCLITDYSSLMFDFAYFSNKGIVLYTFDYDQYVANDRDFFFPFEGNSIGHRTETFDDLCRLISTGAALSDLPPDRLAKCRADFWGGAQPFSAPAIVRTVERLLSRPS